MGWHTNEGLRVTTVHIHQFVDEGLGHSSYVIDLGDGTAAMVDPPRFPTAQEALIADQGLQVVWTIDTHSHADYVTGSPGLVERVGATFVAPAASRLATSHQPVRDGDRTELTGGVTLVAIATPGHTPDHHAYLLEQQGQPIGLFTGGSLMVGAVGRTDLCGPDLAEPLAHDMFRSLKRFQELPDSLPIYPTHGAGSFCSAPGAADRTSTLRRERSTNPLFGITDEDVFVERLLSGFGTFPEYFSRLPELNRTGPRVYDTLPTLTRLTVDAARSHIAAGGLVVDVRPFDSFGGGHIPGSLSNTLRPVFASWLGWLVPPGRQLLFVLEADQDRAELVRQCLDVGLEHLLGELDGGIEAWIAAGEPIATVGIVDVEHLASSVIDVRQANEFEQGHIPSAANIELAAVKDHAPKSGAITVMCGHGERAMTGASILSARGQRDITVLAGGPDTWAEFTGQPLTRS